MRYGYVRVSSKDQNIDRQMEAMRQADVPLKNIIIDKQSGKDFNRDGYQQLLEKLKPNDELFLKSIDRLGRDYDEIIEQWRVLTRNKAVDVVVLDFPLLDTRNPVHGLTGKFMADLALQILSYAAQLERENIHQRQREGIREAQKKGVRFGRPTTPLPENYEEVREMWRKGDISLRQGARLLGTTHATFSKWLRETS